MQPIALNDFMVLKCASMKDIEGAIYTMQNDLQNPVLLNPAFSSAEGPLNIWDGHEGLGRHATLRTESQLSVI
jgi:hypothetical protein